MKWFQLLLISVLILWGGNTVAEEASLKPTWTQPLREATVALGTIKKAKITLPDGIQVERDIFGIIGTGVILGLPEDESKTPWLVTAKHVFHNPNEGWDPKVIRLRFAWFEDQPVEDYLGIPIKLKDKGQRLWTPHPIDSVDLAAIPLRISKDAAGRDSAPIIPLDNFARVDDVYEGASILVLGYPAAIGPTFWTKALTRSGIIAWVNPKNPAGEPLVIDSEMFKGNSGGPVFKVPTGIKRDGGFKVGGKILFLGIVSRGTQEDMPVEAEGKRIQIEGSRGPISVEAKQWMSIGIVEPAKRVVQLLKAAAK